MLADISLLVKSDGEEEALLAAFRGLAPGMDVRAFPRIGNAEDLDYALVAPPQADLFDKMPNLKAIFSRWTGIGHIDLTRLPSGIPVIPMADRGMTTTMVAHVAQQVLALHGRARIYQEQQKEAVWAPHQVTLPSDRRVGFLGLGRLGLACAEAISGLGFDVAGWTRTPRSHANIICFSGMDELDEILRRSDILVSVLPLTEETKGLLDQKRLARLPKGASIVNVGRGEHLVEPALMDALDSGHLEGAALDVFCEEPLPSASPLWAHPRVTVTPHNATASPPETAAAFVCEAIEKIEKGGASVHEVDRAVGY